jgi:SAM-dependent methyltransferase
MGILKTGAQRANRLYRFMRSELARPLRHRFEQVRHYGIAPSIEDFLLRSTGQISHTESRRTLDLGCGNQVRNPFAASVAFGVDLRGDPSKNILVSDLVVGRIPFPDNYFDYVTAFDFIEHVPRILSNGERTQLPFINLMNEIHRVLKDGGLFLSYTPAYPSKQAFQDPTHVNIITEDTFPLYFCGPSWASIYGFEGRFELVKQEWYSCWLITLLVKGSSSNGVPS